LQNTTIIQLLQDAKSISMYIFSVQDFTILIRAFKSQSVTCYTVSTACDIIKTFDINMCDVCFIHYFQIIYIDLQPISKNSLTLFSAEYGFYFNHLVHVFFDTL